VSKRPFPLPPNEITRRRALAQAVIASSAAAVFVTPQLALAVVTDETNTFADNWWATPTIERSTPSSLPSDELVIAISKDDLRRSGGLGVELAEIEFRTNLRVYVKAVTPGSLASKLGIQQDWIVVALDKRSTERTNVLGVAQMLAAAVKDSPSDVVEFRFRDPSVFRQKLQALSEGESVTTQVAPAGDTTQRNADGSIKSGRDATSQAEQQITVSQLIPPKLCKRGATTDDLLEISYRGSVVETGQVFDGSAIKIDGGGIPGRGDDVSLYFVLGKQPFGQFPPGWDVGMVGQCVGERRRLIIPPALAYGSKGVPRRGIPPDATLQYDITLVSLNGFSTPQ